MAVKAISDFLSHDKIKRVLALGVFVGGLVLLRHLATLLVFTLILAASLGWMADGLHRLTRLSAKVWVLVLVVLALGGAGGLAYSGVLKSIPMASRAVKEAQTQAKRLKQSSIYKMVSDAHLEPEQFGKQIEHFGRHLTHGLQITGRALLHLALALILAVLYLMERDEVDPIFRRLPATSFFGYLMSFYRYLCEAVVLTVKVQVIVALVNAVVTLPVMLLLKLPHIIPLMILVFIFGLVPVVGNFLSGLVLVALSYMTKGWTASFWSPPSSCTKSKPIISIPAWSPNTCSCHRCC
jgi:predicted PurR-regulated permease PerM